MVPLAARWTAERQQVPDDVPETAGWRFHLYNDAGEDLYQVDHPVEARELGSLIEVGAGTYTVKSRRLDGEGREFGDEVASAPLTVQAGTVLRLVMTSLQLRIGESGAGADADVGGTLAGTAPQPQPHTMSPQPGAEKHDAPAPPAEGASAAGAPSTRSETGEPRTPAGSPSRTKR